MPKVLISDSIDKIAAEILESNNIQVDTITDLSSDKLKEIISKYDKAKKILIFLSFSIFSKTY